MSMSFPSEFTLKDVYPLMEISAGDLPFEPPQIDELQFYTRISWPTENAIITGDYKEDASYSTLIVSESFAVSMRRGGLEFFASILTPFVDDSEQKAVFETLTAKVNFVDGKTLLFNRDRNAGFMALVPNHTLKSAAVDGLKNYLSAVSYIHDEGFVQGHWPAFETIDDTYDFFIDYCTSTRQPTGSFMELEISRDDIDYEQAPLDIQLGLDYPERLIGDGRLLPSSIDDDYDIRYDPDERPTGERGRGSIPVGVDPITGEENTEADKRERAEEMRRAHQKGEQLPIEKVAEEVEDEIEEYFEEN